MRYLVAATLCFLATMGLLRVAVATENTPPIRIELRLEIGPKTTVIRFSRQTTTDDPMVRRMIGRHYPSDDDLCAMLHDIALRETPVCQFFFRNAGFDPSPNLNFRIKDGGANIKFERTLETSAFIQDRELQFDVAPQADPSIAIDMRFLPPFAVTAVWPVPEFLADARVVFRLRDLLTSEDAKSQNRLLLYISVDEKIDTTRDAALKRGPPSIGEDIDPEKRAELLNEAWRTLLAIGRACTWLTLVLFAAALARKHPANTSAAPSANRAERLCVILGALCMIGILCREPYLYRSLGGLTRVWLVTAVSSWFPDNGEFYPAAHRLAGNLADVMITAGAAMVRIILVAVVLFIALRLSRWLRWRQPVRVTRILGFAGLAAALSMAFPFLLDMAESGLGHTTGMWPYQFYVMAGSLPTVVLVAIVIGSAARLYGINVPRVLPVLAAIAMLAVLIPTRDLVTAYSLTYRPDGVAVVQPALATTAFFIEMMAAAALAVPLIWLLPRGTDAFARAAVRGSAITIGGIAFACTLDRPGQAEWWGLVSVLVAALVIWPRLMMAEPGRLARRQRNLLTVQANAATWIERLERAADLQAAAQGSVLNGKLASGDLTPESWAQARSLLEVTRDRAIETTFLADGMSARELVLGTGMQRDPWQRGRHAVVSALPVIAVLSAIGWLQVNPSAEFPHPGLYWIANVVTPLMAMTALVFLFGYFFDLLRGETGLHKALLVAGCLCLAELPLWVPRFTGSSAVAGMAWSFSQHFLLLIPVGVIAFDYARMRAIEGHTFDWRRFSWFGDARVLSAGVAASLAAVAPVIATLVSSSFADAVKDVATAVVPVLPFGH